jgi:hypothetical protein
MNEEYRQLKMAGLSVSGCPLNAYNQSYDRIKCLLSREFGETRGTKLERFADIDKGNFWLGPVLNQRLVEHYFSKLSRTFVTAF